MFRSLLSILLTISIASGAGAIPCPDLSLRFQVVAENKLQLSKEGQKAFIEMVEKRSAEEQQLILKRFEKMPDGTKWFGLFTGDLFVWFKRLSTKDILEVLTISSQKDLGELINAAVVGKRQLSINEKRAIALLTEQNIYSLSAIREIGRIRQFFRSLKPSALLEQFYQERLRITESGTESVIVGKPMPLEEILTQISAFNPSLTQAVTFRFSSKTETLARMIKAGPFVAEMEVALKQRVAELEKSIAEEKGIQKRYLQFEKDKAEVLIAVLHSDIATLRQDIKAFMAQTEKPSVKWWAFKAAPNTLKGIENSAAYVTSSFLKVLFFSMGVYGVLSLSNPQVAPMPIPTTFQPIEVPKVSDLDSNNDKQQKLKKLQQQLNSQEITQEQFIKAVQELNR